MIKFSTPALAILFTNDEGKETEIEKVQTTAQDQFAFDMLRRNHKNLPSQSEAPMMWAYILAFNALRRKKLIGEHHTFDSWIENNLLNVEIVTDKAPANLAQQ